MRNFFLAVGAIAILFACSKDEDQDPVGIPGPTGDTSTCFTLKTYDTQLPNMNFETWGNPANSNGKFEEPCGGVWASGNGGSILATKVVCEKTTDAKEGMYAVRMESHNVIGQLAAGSVYTGKFLLNLDEPHKSAKLGVPFNKKPVSMDGWYKYTSVDGDSAQIMVLLTSYNTTKKVRDTVAYGLFVEYSSVTSWKEFSTVLDYNYSAGTQTPDTVVASFTSSKGSTEVVFVGSAGSTLYVDDCKFVY